MEENKTFIIAIDGPAGSGKGTITERISQKLGLVNIGSGSAYRCVALETINQGIEIEEKEKIIKMLENIKIEFDISEGKDTVYLNGKNVTDRIREKDVATIVSQVSAIKEVRIKLNDIFRSCAEGKRVIMEGRDIGTCVYPNADVKIYLDASPEIRAKRRLKQNEEKHIEMSYEEILQNIKTRDEIDKNKEMGALKLAEDATYVDSSNMTIEEVTDKILNIIKEKTNK